MLASSISQVLVLGGRGFCTGAPHGLQLGFGCHVICVLLLLWDSSHCALICWFARFADCILPWAGVRQTIVCKRHQSIKWQAGKVVQVLRLGTVVRHSTIYLLRRPLQFLVPSRTSLRGWGPLPFFPHPGLSLPEPLERSHAVSVADPENLPPFFF